MKEYITKENCFGSKARKTINKSDTMVIRPSIIVLKFELGINLY